MWIFQNLSLKFTFKVCNYLIYIQFFVLLAFISGYYFFLVQNVNCVGNLFSDVFPIISKIGIHNFIRYDKKYIHKKWLLISSSKMFSFLQHVQKFVLIFLHGRPCSWSDKVFAYSALYEGLLLNCWGLETLFFGNL